MALDTDPVVFNPLDPTFRVDPYPVYRRLLEEDPTHLSPLGAHVFSRYTDCLALLRHPLMSSDPRRATTYEQFRATQSPAVRAAAAEVEERRAFLFLDPPDHTRLRGLVSKAFTPRVVEGLRPRVQALVDGFLDQVEAKGEMDVIEDLAYPLPVAVICEMLGVPAADHETFKGWSRELARSLDPDIVMPEELVLRRLDALSHFHDYFRQLIAIRRSDPGPDLLSALLAAEEAGQSLSEDELLATCTLLLVAGHETTVNLIGNGVLALLRHPRELSRLVEDPSLIRTTVEEVLRWDPPVQLDGRVALQDVEIGGVTVVAGEQPVILLAAANRDGSHFPDPDRFDVGRQENRHLSFGSGIHHCLGASLARLEGQVALGTLVRRIPGLELATDTLDYRDNIVLRGLESLPVTL